MRHTKYKRRVCGSGDNDSGNVFEWTFIWKEKMPLTHIMSSKYDTGQERLPGPPEYRDSREKEIPKFATCKHIIYLVSDGGRRVFQRRSHSGAQ